MAYQGKVAKVCRALVLFGILVLLEACAGKMGRNDIGLAPVSKISIGEEILLLDTATEKVAASMSANGKVHLLAITGSRKAYHLIVSDKGVERKEKIGTGNRSYGYYSALAMAEDREGRLHAMLKGDHLIFHNGEWQPAGISSCQRLTRTGDSLVCAHVVNGKQLKAPAQWGILGFGAGIAWWIPYRLQPSKLVIARADGREWLYSSAIDPYSQFHTRLDTSDDVILTSDRLGNAYLLYRAHLDSTVYVRFASVPLSDSPEPTVEWLTSEGQVIELADCPSIPVGLPSGWYVPFGGLSFAVDPQTGRAVFFARASAGIFRWVDGVVEIQSKRFSTPSPLPFMNGQPKKLAPAGGGRFHALVAVDHKLLYLTYRKEGWSSPIRIGEFGTPHIFLIADGSIQLVSDGRGCTLAIWPKRDGSLVGRWITLDGQQ
jgi:hypothetical protein